MLQFVGRSRALSASGFGAAMESLTVEAAEVWAHLAWKLRGAVSSMTAVHRSFLSDMYSTV